MRATDHDLLFALGVRIAFEPPERGNSNGPTLQWTQWMSDVVAAGGYGYLQANPKLEVRWYQFNSQYAKKPAVFRIPWLRL